MLSEVARKTLFQHDYNAASGYWYHLAIRGLVLDRPPHSVRLEAPLHEIPRVPAPAVSSRGGGQNESV